MSRFLKIILPVIAVVFLVAGYLYLTGKTKLNNQPVEEIAETNDFLMEENIKIEPQKNKITETSDWKIYRNEKYGFEFKYPGEYKKTDKGDIFIHLSSVEIINTDFKKPDINALKRFVDEFIQEQNCRSNDFPEEGDRVIETTDKGIYYVEFCTIAAEVYHYVTKLNDNFILKFDYHDNLTDNSADKKIKTFKEIISTLKFTD